MIALAPRAQVQLQRCTRRGWVPPTTELRRWADAALGRAAAGCEISVLVVGMARSRALNGRYRGRDHATNVLSFPATAVAGVGVGAQGRARRAVLPHLQRTRRLLGDIVICAEVLRREARAQHKSERAHWAHLVVHGVLHLAGFDHERDADAQRMQRREVRALRSLGIGNPYRSA